MTSRRSWMLLDAGALALLYTLAWVVLRTPLYLRGPELLEAAVAFDLVVTATLVHGLVRARAGLPRWTLGLPALLGVALVSWWMPAAHDGGLLLGLMVLAELLVGGVALQRVATLWRAGREAQQGGATWVDAAEKGLAEALESPRLAAAAIAEVQLVAYGLFGVFRRAPTTGFTHHRRAGWLAVAGALCFLSLPELVGVHMLLERVAPAWVAWGVSALTVYGVLWLWGDAMALRLHPSTVHDGVLRLRLGLRYKAEVPLDDVLEVREGADDVDVDLALMGLSDFTLVLARPLTLQGPFGTEVVARTVALQVDDPEGFRRAITEGRASTSR